MKSRNLIALALAAASIGVSSATWADGPMQRVIRAQTNAVQHVDDRREHHRDHRDHRADRRDDRRDWRADRREDRRDWRAERREERREWREERWHHRHHRHHHAAPAVHHHYYHARGPEFRRGRPIPYQFRHHQYVVVNHHIHHLAPPPRGHHWVQVGSDYVLIAVATGLIAHVILSQ